jgi:hypothetical protein
MNKIEFPLDSFNTDHLKKVRRKLWRRVACFKHLGP